MSDGEAKAGSAPWGRLAVSVIAFAAPFALARVRLPVDHQKLAAGGAGEAPGLFALGVMPFLIGSVLVEVGALVTPDWAKLRYGAAGRLRLRVASVVIGLAVAALSARVIWGPLSADLADDKGALGIVIGGLTLGSLALFALAEIANRRGLVNGFVAVAAGGLLANDLGRAFGLLLSSSMPAGTGAGLAVMGAAKLGVFAATFLVLRSPAAKAGALPVAVPTPASGVAPLALAVGLLALPATLASLSGDKAGAFWIPSDLVHGLAGLALSIAGAILLSRLLHDPGRLATIALRARKDVAPREELEAEARARLRAAWLPTVAFAVVLFVAREATRRLAGFPLDVAALALFMGMVVDGVAEWKARSSFPGLTVVWSEHRPFAAEAVRSALAAREIAVHARGSATRTLLQFWGPFAPIEIAVAPDDAERAQKTAKRALRARTSAKQAEAVTAGEETPAEARSLAGLALLLGTLAVVVPSFSGWLVTKPPAGPKLEAGVFALSAVDDDLAEPFAGIPGALPTGVSLKPEAAAGGPEGEHSVTYARLVPSEGESLDHALARVKPWFDAVALPKGRRFGFGLIYEHNEVKDAIEAVGFRTYVLVDEPITTGADVLEATVVPPAPPDPKAPPEAAEEPMALVRISLGPAAADKLWTYTREHQDHRLAFVVEDRVVTAPVIQSEIKGGTLAITMGLGGRAASLAEARRLVKKLGGR